MTVCIAAICKGNSIVGCADRMLTSGDIEFEPDLDVLPVPEHLKPEDKIAFSLNGKIFQLTRFIAALTAGDSGLQAEILQGVYQTVTQRIFTDRERWWGVKEIAELYVVFYNQAKAKRLQTEIFEPLNLNVETFIARQGEMKTDFLTNITDKIQRFEYNFRAVHGVETIVAGLDMSGFNSTSGKSFFMPHIYTVFKSVNGDGINCCDPSGFAAVGGGMRHAESQFMLAGHSSFSPMPETLLLTYMAKKRSEIAPGVGKKGTDMFVIEPQTTGFAMLANIDDLETKKIESIYSSMDKSQSKAFVSAKEKIKIHVDSMLKKRAEKQQSQVQQKSQKSPLDLGDIDAILKNYSTSSTEPPTPTPATQPAK
jgi:hypothetical protein